jgi:hypothetical protein
VCSFVRKTGQGPASEEAGYTIGVVGSTAPPEKLAEIRTLPTDGNALVAPPQARVPLTLGI